jgi:hypothetical protein
MIPKNGNRFSEKIIRKTKNTQKINDHENEKARVHPASLSAFRGRLTMEPFGSTSS